MKLSYFLIFLFMSHLINGQITISGTTKSADNIRLPYVSIGIKHRDIGTISNENGEFTLQISDKLVKDTLTFSYVGYSELNIPVKNIEEFTSKDFILTPKVTSLEEVIISNKKIRSFKRGIKSFTAFIFSPPINDKTNDIIEFAQYINIGNNPSKILSTSIMFRTKDINDTVTLRINFYSIENELPFEKIYEKNIIEVLAIKNGWQTIDLSKYNIKLDENFFISYEFIPNGRKHTFTYAARLGGELLTRKNSLGKWTKQKGASLSAYVTIEQ